MRDGDGAQLPMGRFEWEKALRQSSLSSTAKLVGLVLATYANSDGTRIYPGVVQTMAAASVSRQTVVKGTQVLRDHQWLLRVGNGNRAGRADEYRLTRGQDGVHEVDLIDSDGVNLTADEVYDVDRTGLPGRPHQTMTTPSPDHVPTTAERRGSAFTSPSDLGLVFDGAFEPEPDERPNQWDLAAARDLAN